MKVRYVGVSFGADSLTDGKIYDVVDDSGEDYLYSPQHPRPAAVPDHPGGRWEIVEDDENGTLRKAICG